MAHDQAREYGGAARVAAAAAASARGADRSRSRRRSSSVREGSECGSILLHSLLETQREGRRRSQDLTWLDGVGSGADGSDSDSGSDVAAAADIAVSATQQRLAALQMGSAIADGDDDEALSLVSDGSGPQRPRRNTGRLTKRQLADITFSVRDLSKYLGNIRIKLAARQVMIVSKIWDSETVAQTRALADWLAGERTTVYVEDVLKTMATFAGRAPPGDHVQYWNKDTLATAGPRVDLLITLGGDGTVLYTSWLFQQIVPPVLSFNMGSLGFLTKFDFAAHEAVVRQLMTHGVVISLRMRFECTVVRIKARRDTNDLSRPSTLHLPDLERDEGDGETAEDLASYNILNDLVIDRGPNATMCATEIFADEEHLTSVEADGVVVATPTGSTAYSLSAGGSLVHPDIQGMLISPICAHTLSFRPLVIPDSTVLRIGVPRDARSSAWCSFDGRDRIELCAGDYVRVRASRYPFAMVQNRRIGSDWYESLSTTLGWNQRTRQKRFEKPM
ncbi:ATP-NAD kinase-like domain-containing protein [Dipodascopsis tothii]|uniref:ATP-NAD kinase-like domain-containing protein n=1 Tax=Dipodascopsis tothii TaxID=44089 RepID=UPI0034CF9DA1